MRLRILGVVRMLICERDVDLREGQFNILSLADESGAMDLT